MEYTTHMYWQQQGVPHPQHMPAHNGQRLFTAMSDPGVCGYSVPVTYAMEPVSLPPMYRLYQPMPRPNYRPFRGRTRPVLSTSRTGRPVNQDVLVNGYSSLQENGINRLTPGAYQNGDYASLPPNANVDNKDNGEDLSSEHRRYSDPGLGPIDIDLDSQSDSAESSASSITTVGRSNKLVLTLLEQVIRSIIVKIVSDMSTRTRS